MKALAYHTSRSHESKSNNIPLFPDLKDDNNSGKEKKATQIIPLITAGNMEPLISSLRNDLKDFCDLFAAGKRSLQENILYTLQLQRKLKEYHIPFDVFVRATI